MEKNNKELTQLEYLINFRAISYSTKNCWFYLTLKQKLAFVAIMVSMTEFAESGKKTVTLSELIKKCKDRLDLRAEDFQKIYGKKIGTTYSKEVIRTTIYACFPIYLNVTQHGRPKIISLTAKAKEFCEWINTTFVSKENHKVYYNWDNWLTNNKINFVEDSPTNANNSSTAILEKTIKNS